MSEVQVSSSFGAIGNVWDDLANTVKIEFGAITYRNWLGHLRFKSYEVDEDGEGNVLTLEAPTKFISQWIETNYAASLITLCTRNGIDVRRIIIEVNSNAAVATTQQSPTTDLNEYSKQNYKTDEASNDGPCDVFDFNLDPKFIFDNFVVGASNKVAYSAAMAVASGEGSNKITSNILYIHGVVGQGKTHLLQAIASFVKSNTGKKITYLSAEKFMHLYLKYMRANNLIGFKEKIKSCEIFLVDDLQFICGKVATQQEFSNLLSALTEANKTVVISSDINPFMLQLDARSKSRLVGGFVVEITASDYDLRLNILKLRRSYSSVAIADEVLDFIAKNIVSSNRELEGALNKLIAYANFEDSAITMSSAQNLLKANLESAQTTIDIEHIIAVVAKFYSINTGDITSKSRSAKFILPRQISAYFAKHLTTKSLYDIGQALGKRDHASIIYYVKQVDKKILTDPKLECSIQEIELLIKNVG